MSKRTWIMVLVLLGLAFYAYRWNGFESISYAKFTRNADDATATIYVPDNAEPRVIDLFAKPEVRKAGLELENWRKNFEPKGPSFLPPTTYTGEAYEKVPYGNSLILGGWETSPGRRLMLFISPEPVDGGTNVMVKNRFVEVSYSELQEHKLDWLINPEKAVTLDKARAKAVFEHLEAMAGADLLSTPTVQVASGREAQVQVHNALPGGFYSGPSIWFVPEVIAEAQEIALGVRVEVNLGHQTDSGQK